MSNKSCIGCKFLYKKYNICLNDKCFIRKNAQLLKHSDDDFFRLTICKENNFFTAGKNTFEKDGCERNSKFNAKKVTIDGITFDSTSEGKRYSELKLLERAGKIKDLKLQPKFSLELSETKKRFYIADFQYYEVDTKKEVVEDVKGVKTSVYNLKKIRFLELYPQYEFKEVYNKKT